jgi:hopanoid biosynthesis associated protein HpnK
VEIAHTNGVLTAASLMVGGAAAHDAVERAKRLPNLRVGLHLVLVESRPVLPPERIPDIVTPNGFLRTDLAGLGAAIFLLTSVRRQVEAEIVAQFEAFAATGLALDHVNAHKHFHLHPTVASLLLEIGPRYGMRAVRSPVEPRAVLRSIDRGRAASDWLAQTWATRLRQRLRRSGVKSADQVFGNAWSGAMSAERISGLLRRLPRGVTEIYTHPAVSAGFEGAARDYGYAAELAALTSDLVAEALRECGATTGGYLDAAAP